MRVRDIKHHNYLKFNIKKFKKIHNFCNNPINNSRGLDI